MGNAHISHKGGTLLKGASLTEHLTRWHPEDPEVDGGFQFNREHSRTERNTTDHWSLTSHIKNCNIKSDKLKPMGITSYEGWQMSFSMDVVTLGTF